MVAHPSRVTLRCKRLCSSSAREIYPNHSTPHCILQAHCSLPGQPQPRYLSGECRRGETSPTGPPQWLCNPRHCECTDSAFQIPCRLAVHSDAGCVYVWRGWGAVSKCGLEFCISHHSPNASHFHAIPHGDAGEQHSDSYMARKESDACGPADPPLRAYARTTLCLQTAKLWTEAALSSTWAGDRNVSGHLV